MLKPKRLTNQRMVRIGTKARMSSVCWRKGRAVRHVRGCALPTRYARELAVVSQKCYHAIVSKCCQVQCVAEKKGYP
jgi:hypothetical protein